MDSGRVGLGCEVLADSPPAWFRTARLGLLTNQASYTSRFEHVSDLIRGAGGRIHCLFSPQHGYFSEKQANMHESSDAWDSSLEVPIYSLYGTVREPTEEMLAGLDVLLVDLQDVGTRVYTYSTTVGLCIEAAARFGLKVVVLDRPNPVNGSDVEGNVLKEEYRSFVGRYPVPMRHGLTLGEFARFVVRGSGFSCDLQVIPMRGWKRGQLYPDTQLPWCYPSPNMPLWETALLYPGMVLLEGTNVSEGRGTTLPFHLFGAPFLDQKRVGRLLTDQALDGVALRPVSFEPVWDKWKKEPCHGFQIHVTDPRRVRPYRLGLALLRVMLEVHDKDFEWLPPPYEYEWKQLPIDILLGDGQMRVSLERGESLASLEGLWTSGLIAYREQREACLLYK
ncbi:MAG: DUF1343 domain-containing protein [Syntrophobacteraceae bacterium]|nr:DUF1343 domain-containing protein [Syntrophobacteraceae bacterium]